MIPKLNNLLNALLIEIWKGNITLKAPAFLIQYEQMLVERLSSPFLHKNSAYYRL